MFSTRLVWLTREEASTKWWNNIQFMQTCPYPTVWIQPNLSGPLAYVIFLPLPKCLFRR